MKPVTLPFGSVIYQSKAGQSITSDTSALVEEVLKRTTTSSLNILELGSGNGIISIMLSHYRPFWDIIGIEIQAHLVKLAINNAKIAEVKTKFINSDLTKFTSHKKFNIVVSNPPYYPKDKGKISPIEERAISRHEIRCNMQEVLLAIKRNLHITGKSFVLYPHKREEDLDKFTKKVDLIVKDKIILKSIGKNKKMMVVELIHA